MGQKVSSVICMTEAERRPRDPRQQQRGFYGRTSPSAAPIMPVLTLPKLPKLIPGKPLDPQQREELVVLQQQIQAQLMQQRVLVESIRQLPQFRDVSASSHSVMDRTMHHIEFMHSWHHLVAPDPVGDMPLDDPENGNYVGTYGMPEEIRDDESKPSTSTYREHDEISNSTLGTTTKVYVNFGVEPPCPPDIRKDDFSSLLEWEELMKRGGYNGEDTGEPSIQSPKSSLPYDPFDKHSEQASVSNASKQSVSVASKVSISSKNSRKSALESNASKNSLRNPKGAKEGPTAKEASRKIYDSPAKAPEGVVAEELSFQETTAAAPAYGSTAAFGQSVQGLKDGFSRNAADNPLAPRRPVPSPPPLKERPELTMPTLNGVLEPADPRQMGDKPPSREERRWIEAAVRRMFRSLGPVALENITEAFRQWKLPACTMIVKQQSPIASGPGLCVLFDGVVDVLHRPMGSQVHEKVCTYDRCGQCFGELELFYDVPRGQARKQHWATIATRTPATLWTVDRETLRGSVPGAEARPPPIPEMAASGPTGLP